MYLDLPHLYGELALLKDRFEAIALQLRHEADQVTQKGMLPSVDIITTTQQTHASFTGLRDMIRHEIETESFDDLRSIEMRSLPDLENILNQVELLERSDLQTKAEAVLNKVLKIRHIDGIMTGLNNIFVLAEESRDRILTLNIQALLSASQGNYGTPSPAGGAQALSETMNLINGKHILAELVRFVEDRTSLTQDAWKRLMEVLDQDLFISGSMGLLQVDLEADEVAVVAAVATNENLSENTSVELPVDEINDDIVAEDDKPEDLDVIEDTGIFVAEDLVVVDDEINLEIATNKDLEVAAEDEAFSEEDLEVIAEDEAFSEEDLEVIAEDEAFSEEDLEVEEVVAEEDVISEEDLEVIAENEVFSEENLEVVAENEPEKIEDMTNVGEEDIIVIGTDEVVYGDGSSEEQFGEDGLEVEPATGEAIASTGDGVGNASHITLNGDNKDEFGGLDDDAAEETRWY